jgi:hypothetical protein
VELNGSIRAAAVPDQGEEQGSRHDSLLYWLLANYEDNGTLRDRRRARRIIVIDGTEYYLVKKDQDPAKVTLNV